MQISLNYDLNPHLVFTTLNFISIMVLLLTYFCMYRNVKIEIEKLLETGVIEPSNSPWSSPISIAVKKDNSIRICLDMRKVNALTRKDAKSTPNIDEMFDALTGKKIFSSLDLLQGFHQIPLSEKSKEYTAFTAAALDFISIHVCPSACAMQLPPSNVLWKLY